MTVQPLLIYLAGPQDDVSKSTARRWREKLAAGAPAGVAFFSPAHAYLNVNRVSFPVVDMMNRAAINGSHAVIANLGGQGMGFGTIREVEFALSVRTPVWVVGPVGHSLMTHDLRVVDTVDDALASILFAVDDLRAKMSGHPLSMLFPWLGHQEQEE